MHVASGTQLSSEPVSTQDMTLCKTLQSPGCAASLPLSEHACPGVRCIEGTLLPWAWSTSQALSSQIKPRCSSYRLSTNILLRVFPSSPTFCLESFTDPSCSPSLSASFPEPDRAPHPPQEALSVSFQVPTAGGESFPSMTASNGWFLCCTLLPDRDSVKVRKPIAFFLLPAQDLAQHLAPGP